MPVFCPLMNFPDVASCNGNESSLTDPHTAVQSQTTVPAHLTSKQILPFGFANWFISDCHRHPVNILVVFFMSSTRAAIAYYIAANHSPANNSLKPTGRDTDRDWRVGLPWASLKTCESAHAWDLISIYKHLFIFDGVIFALCEALILYMGGRVSGKNTIQARNLYSAYSSTNVPKLAWMSQKVSRASPQPQLSPPPAPSVFQVLYPPLQSVAVSAMNRCMRRWGSVGLLLGQRRRRWANSKSTLGQHPWLNHSYLGIKSVFKH